MLCERGSHVQEAVGLYLKFERDSNQNIRFVTVTR